MLARRRSSRTFASEPVSADLIAGLLWSGYGFPARRAVPSGGGLYPLQIDLILLRPAPPLAEGIYRVACDAAYGVGLQRIDADVGPVWRAWGNPAVLSHAQGVIVVSSDFHPTSEKYGNRAALLVTLEAGHVAQNISLAAAEADLGLVEFAGFEEQRLTRALGNPDAMTPLISLVFGALPDASQVALAAAVPAIDFHWLDVDLGTLHVGCARAGNEDGEWSWGHAVDPRLAHLKANAEALERLACGTAGSLLPGRMADFDRAIPPDAIAAYLPGQYRRPAFPFARHEDQALAHWAMAEDVIDGHRVAVLADFVYFAPALPEPVGKPHSSASTSGVAAHPSRAEAMETAVLELVERDAFMTAWLSGQSLPTIARSGLPATIRYRLDQLQRKGFEVTVKDISRHWAPVLMLFAQSHALGITRVAAAAGFEREGVLDHALAELEAGLACAANHRPDPLTPCDVVLPADHGRLYRQKRYYRRADFLAQDASVITLDQAGSETPQNWPALLDAIAARGHRLLWIDLTVPGSALAQGRQPLVVGRAIMPGLVPINFGYGTEALGLPRAREHLFHPGRRPSGFRPLFPHPFA
ncbi:MAG: YcaO-like family protein [Rhodocyclales bacterium]|nr:YcaO-like family protein [Rhodocyclales bacterium]